MPALLVCDEGVDVSSCEADGAGTGGAAPGPIVASVFWKGFLMMGTSTVDAEPVAEFIFVLSRSSSLAEASSSLSLLPNGS